MVIKGQKGLGRIQASGKVMGEKQRREPSRLAGLMVKLKSSEVARERHKSSYLITFFMAFQVQKSCKQKMKMI